MLQLVRERHNRIEVRAAGAELNPDVALCRGRRYEDEAAQDYRGQIGDPFDVGDEIRALELEEQPGKGGRTANALDDECLHARIGCAQAPARRSQQRLVVCGDAPMNT